MAKKQPTTLSLTDKQKKMMEIMITSVPGWNFDSWDGDDYYNEIWVKFKDGTIDSFHWFEFLMLHLAPKLHPTWKSVNPICVMIERINRNVHPVDSLYKLFKKDLAR